MNIYQSGLAKRHAFKIVQAESQAGKQVKLNVVKQLGIRPVTFLAKDQSSGYNINDFIWATRLVGVKNRKYLLIDLAEKRFVKFALFRFFSLHLQLGRHALKQTE